MKDAALAETGFDSLERSNEPRAEFLTELWRSFGEGGPQAVTEQLVGRIDALAETFTNQLQELKKQL
jgi:hypothetical protein